MSAAQGKSRESSLRSGRDPTRATNGTASPEEMTDDTGNGRELSGRLRLGQDRTALMPGGAAADLSSTILEQSLHIRLIEICLMLDREV